MIFIGDESKDFHAWLKNKYKWLDRDVKALMYRAWLARAGSDKSNHEKHTLRKYTESVAQKGK